MIDKTVCSQNDAVKVVVVTNGIKIIELSLRNPSFLLPNEII